MVYRICGIDPGTATVGYGVVDLHGKEKFELIAAGIIETSRQLDAGQRLKIIREDLLSLIELYKPDVMVVEAIFFARNAKTVVSVAQARGVILEASAASNVAVAEYTPMQVKLNITGFGRAEKKEVQNRVASLLGHGSIIKPDDAADAVALAICHSRMAPMPSLA
jgi:crossover junction endodeoxyribonuclease RuvC